MPKKAKKQEPGSKKIRQGDQIIVIAGNYKGQQGKVLHIDGSKVTVEGINLCKKHVRPSQANPKGGMNTFEKPIDISNIKLCVNDKGVKLHVNVDNNGERSLCYRLNGEVVTYRKMKESPKS